MEDNTNVSLEQKPETNVPESKTEPTSSESNQEQEVTVESLMAELAKERAEKEKTKVALDKTLKEQGIIKKQLREKQTAEEQEAEAKKEQEEQHKAYVKSLEDTIKLTEATNRYISMGMDVELAKNTAEAEISGTPEGRDTVFANIQKMTNAKIKNAQAEWLKSRPPVTTGTESQGEKDDFLEGFNKC